MNRVLLVGIATLDIINEVERYPHEDAEVRTLGQHTRLGGNAANTAVVLRQLDCDCEFMGCLANDSGAAYVRSALTAAGIGLSHAPVIPNGATPTSYIALSRDNGSRTIIHHRDLPELRCRDFTHINTDDYDWFHFEGRNVDVTAAMLRAIAGRTPTSVEIEKPRADIETLFPLADVLLFSRHYALSMGHNDPRAFLENLHTNLPRQRLICAWGEAGAAAMERGNYHWADAPRLAQVVDTVGAGDTFNAGIIGALLTGHSLPDALHAAVRLASRKCAQTGFAHLVTTQDRRS